jgi:hypothetical protein
MAALLGREDSLLDPGRFARFLKQANDAEIADVRKLGDDTFEVSPHKTDLSFARAVAAKPEADGNGSTPVAPFADAGARGPVALRFRRGSRAPIRPLELPLVGVVRVDDDVPPVAATPEATKPARPTRSRAPKSAAKSVIGAAAALETAEATNLAPKKKRPRPRARKSG